MINIKESIIQYNCPDFSLYEYTNDKNVILILQNTYLSCIINKIAEYQNEDNNTFCWVENCPTYNIMALELSKINVSYSVNHDAERWVKAYWKETRSFKQFISYWKELKPWTLNEQKEFDLLYDKFRYSKWYKKWR